MSLVNHPRMALLIASGVVVSCGAPGSSTDPGEPLDSSSSPITGAPLPGGIPGVKSPEVGPNVRCNGDQHAAAQHEPAIAGNPAAPGNFLVGARDYREMPADQAPGIYVTRDHGQTWSDGLLDGITQGHGGPFQYTMNPAITCSGRGHCFYAAIAFNADRGGSGVVVAHTPDGGGTWDAPVFVVAEKDPYVSHDKEWLAVDDTDGSLYLAWSRFTLNDDGGRIGSQIYLARSSDLGQSWSAPVQVSPASAPWSRSPHPLVAPGGAVHVVYQTWSDSGVGQHVIQSSSDGGLTFYKPRSIAPVTDNPSPLPGQAYPVESSPWAAVNPATGTVHVVWSDARQGTPVVWASASLDGGKTWLQQRRVGAPPAGAGGYDIMPTVACGPTGLCGVAFYSDRANPGTGLLDVYYTPLFAVAPPGLPPGLWADGPLRVTDFSSDPRAQFAGYDLGRFLGLTIDGAPSAHPTWTDSRDLELQNGNLVPQQDIYTARIPLSRPDSRWAR